MEKKSELYQKSNVEVEFSCLLIYLWLLKTFDGFFVIEFDQTLEILQSKKVTIFIKIVGHLG